MSSSELAQVESETRASFRSTRDGSDLQPRENPAVAVLDGLSSLTSGPDRRSVLMEDGFDRIASAAVAMSGAVETLAEAVALISARGDRIDRLQSDNRERLRGLTQE